MDPTRRQQLFRKARRVVRRGLLVVGGLLVAVVLVLVLVLGLSPARRQLLAVGLEKADEWLAGDLTVGRAEWPRLGRITLHDLAWTDGELTILRADTLVLDVALDQLVHRDLVVREIVLAGAHADLVAIQAHLPPPAPDPSIPVDTTATQAPTAVPHLRLGALPPLPSIALERLAVRRVTIAAAPGQSFDLEHIDARIDLRADRTATLAAGLHVRPLPDLAAFWRIEGTLDPDSLRLAVAPLVIEHSDSLRPQVPSPTSGRISIPREQIDRALAGDLDWPQLGIDDLAVDGDLGRWELNARLNGRDPGSLDVRSILERPPLALLGALAPATLRALTPGALDTLDTRWAAENVPGLDLVIDVTPPLRGAELWRGRVVARGEVVLPAPATFAPLVAIPEAIEGWGAVIAEIDADVDARGTMPTARGRLDLGRTDWIQRAVIAFAADTLQAQLDTLDLQMPGLQLRGRGRADRQTAAMRVRLDIPDATLAELTLQTLLAGPPRTVRQSLESAGLVEPTPGAYDTLAARWSRKGTPGLDLTIDAELPARGDARRRGWVAARGQIVLPAPGAFAPFLPARLRIDDWGPLIAAIDTEVDTRGNMPTARLRLDLGRTGWLDRALLVASADTLHARIDTLDLRLPGLSLRGDGRADRDSVDARLRLEVPDAALASRWEDARLDELEVELQADIAARGSWPLPRIEVDLDAATASPLVTIPRLIAHVEAAPDTVSLDLDLADGLTTASAQLNSLAAAFDGAAFDSLRGIRGRFSLRGAAEQARVDVAGDVDVRGLDTAPAGTLEVASLALALGNRDIVSQQPWTVAFSLADTMVAVDGLKLSGSLGQLQLVGMATVDSVSADLGLDLQLDLARLERLIPDPQWASYLPAAVVTLGGRLRAAGPPRAPWAQGDLRLGFADNEKLGRLAAKARLTMYGRGDPPPQLARLASTGVGPRAKIDVSLTAADTSLVQLRIDAPLPTRGGEPGLLDLRLDADNTDLGHLQPLLPAGTTLRGRLSIGTRMTGSMAFDQTVPELEIAGNLRLRDLRLGLADGSWISLAGGVDLDGTSLAPLVRGGLQVDGGLLRIPDPPPSLLPTHGESMLWQQAGRDSTAMAAVATTEPASSSAGATAGAASDTTGARQLATAILPDLEFQLICPGRLWLRGQGLDVELAGDVSLRLQDGQPTVAGQLEAVQGTMRQLGHVFRLQRGRVVFYADESSLDPELDLLLGVRVGEYQVSIILAGTANRPTLDFESEPELPVGDIMSLLLFGRTADELDEGQSGLVAERARQIAAAYGSVALAEGVGRQIGVDMLTIAPRDDPDQTTALTVGKYLNPQVLVRYEQLLNEASAFFVHLDYTFWKNLKLHTQVSQGQDSGAEIKWEQDW